MPVTKLIILATAILSVILIAGLLVRLWQLAFHFAVPRARMVALLYASIAAAFGGLIIWLIVGWTQQSLDRTLTGHPGPVVLVLLLLAAGTACVPAVVGIVVIRRRLAHHAAKAASKGSAA